MPRKLFASCAEFPYHLTARTNNRDWFSVPMEVVWRIMCEYLYFISHAYRVEIFSFVLMENHFHLIARYPDANLSQAMNYFMRETSRRIAGASGRINHVYGARVFRSRLTNDRYYRCAYKYVYRNPVSAKLADTVESYKYSTLHGLLGVSNLVVPVIEDVMLFDDVEKSLRWLNATPPELDYTAVRLALKRSDFAFVADPATRRLPNIESFEF